MADRSPRQRILQAAYDCVAADGLGGITMEAVARGAGLSRATVYRQFPGGRDELVRAAVDWEVQRFFGRLAEAVADAPDFATLLERGLVFAHRAVLDHDVLQRVLEEDAERLTVELARLEPQVLAIIRGYLVGQLPAALEDRTGGADYVARMVLSFMTSPGSWDLTDPAEVGRLVRTQFLAGIIPM